MHNPTGRCLITIIGLTFSLLTTACGGPRVFVATGTLVGLEATPGNPNDGQAPAVTFGYRRAEAALVPVKKKDDNKVDQPNTTTQPKPKRDAASVLATFNLAHNWFGPAKIEQYIATGLAAQSIANSDYYALALIGYDPGTDELADKLADAYRNAHKDNATDDDKACWESVTTWMDTNFPGLHPTDILTKGFSKQRHKFVEGDADNTCK
ncbi:MAG: hypothetical protein H8K07_18675 [Nitrospira sp.]|jgi:hypothetical protein|nr:hypothetical protein [Nitrospira sp.]MDI3463261.1 hypothetical protein [Nitrospira sp.]